MPAPSGARRGFIGLPGPRARHRHDGAEAYGDLATRYAEAVRRHDEALAELRQVTDAMAAASRSPAPALSLATEQSHAEASGDSGVYAIAGEAETAPAEPEAAEVAPRKRRRNAEETPDRDRPANLRAEVSETGSVCLTWDAAPRDGLLFGIWRAITPREGAPTSFERIAMVREAGFIDSDLPEGARRASYAVRALDGRRPVPGSTHICVTLDESA